VFGLGKERPVTAYLLATVEPNKEYELAEEISKMPGVKKVTITFGMWDLVVEIEAPNREELGRIVTKIREGLKERGLERTCTLLGI